MKLSDLYSLKNDAARAAALSRQWDKQKRRLLGLPAQLGFKSVKELQAALDIVSNDNPKHAWKRLQKPRKKRVKVTAPIKAKLRELVEAKHTGPEIARMLNLAPVTVQNIKTELGLTRHRPKAKHQ